MNGSSNFVDKPLSVDLLLDYLENNLDVETQRKVAERIKNDELERGVWEGLQHMYAQVQDEINPRLAVKKLLNGIESRFNSMMYQKLSIQLFTFPLLFPFLI